MMSRATPETPSNATDEPSESGLPAFTTFQATELETSWDYYERSIVSHQNADLAAQANSYTRPWEMESKEQQHQQQQQQQQQLQQQRGFEPFPKLPSFQSQFHSFADNNLVAEPSLPAQVTAVPVPISPSSASPSGGSLTQLTQLTPSPLTPLQPALTALPNSNFHTLAAVNVQTARGYPIVPAPIQARDIPGMQQQYIDERHIQLYQPITTTATFHHPQPPQPHQGIVTVLKNEHINFDLKNGIHHTSFQSSPMMNNSSFMDTPSMTTPKVSNKNGINGTPSSQVTKETRKKERRKIRASSLESSTESDTSSAMDIDGNSSGNPGQVAAVSSTDNFKSPMHSSMDNGDQTSTGEKQKQKKRKRCGECIGCQKKDNCGECAPCRNDKSHQICKQRRCEKLTEKKIIYSADGTVVRGESRRGRGKGRGGGTSYRGRKSLNLGGVVSPRTKQHRKASVSPAPAAVPQESPNGAAKIIQQSNHQPSNLIGITTTHTTAQQPLQQSQQSAIQQIPSTTATTMKEQPSQPMAPMAFYPTWQTTAATTTTDQPWQNQFIQQIPQNSSAPSVTATAIAPLDFQQGYAYSTNGYVQTGGLQFDPNYNRNATTYSSPVIQRYELQAQPINQVSLQGVSFASNVAYNQIASPTVLFNHQQHHPHYASHQQHTDQLGNKQMAMTTTASGNEMPGYPRVNSVPPRSLSCNGYPGLNEYGGNSINTTANNNQTNTSTSSSQSSQQSLTQSPNRQTPSRPSSCNVYQQQSPNNFHMSPTRKAQSPSQYQQQQSSHAAGGESVINNQHYQHQDWNQNNWNGNPNELYNQSDRINLNTRLKTMILNKNDKDQQQLQQQQQQQQQQQTSTDHFLSYSHQHLPEHQQQQPLSNPTLDSIDQSNSKTTSNSSNNKAALTETGDDGGFKKNDSWESTTNVRQGKIVENKKSESFEQTQFNENFNNNNNNNSGQRTEIKNDKESSETEANNNNTNSNNSNNNNNGQQQSSINHFITSSGSDQQAQNRNELICKSEISKPENVEGEKKKESYSYHSAQEYQQHQNMVNNIKKEVSGEGPGNVKYDGYEKNYQNFIRYADFCDAQQPQYEKQVQYQQDYMQPQGYYNNYPYQNFVHHQSQNYSQPQNYHQFMSQQAAYQQHHSSLTNFEQQIPLHAYPIPKTPTTTASSSSRMSETILPVAEIKAEPVTSIPIHHHHPSFEVGTHTRHDNIVSNYPSRPHKTDNDGSPCKQLSPPKEEVNEKPFDEDAQQEQPKVAVEIQKPVTQSSGGGGSSRSKKQAQKDIYNERNNKPEVPECDCFSSDKKPPEPGSYYTHLGCAATLDELRKEIESRAGLVGKQLRIEKVLYTGKEGKSSQGCPIAKWVIRRVDPEEKALFIVKRRQGHRCNASFVVISIVVWEAMPIIEADNMYKLLVHKLNKFGLPTTRRCATNENRTCACQGLDPETCGASYSFGCSWSMYYNGCKYARSKTVRKFRLSVKSEEAEIEEKMNILATILSPMYKTIAPKAYSNQVQYEVEAPDCRLGFKHGKPFSGVTCCVDFCAHTHRDLHNMQDGCTVQATLLKPRPYGMAPEDEQLHVLPLYTMDATDEFDSEDGQKKKHETGAVTVLEKFPTEVRVRSTPLQPCRRHGKKRGNGSTTDEIVQEQPPSLPPPVTPTPPPTPKDFKPKSRSRNKNASSRAQTPINQNQPQQQPQQVPSTDINAQNQQSSTSLSPNFQQQQNTSLNQQTQLPPTAVNNSNSSTLLDMASMIENFTDAQLQSNQISSTVLDSPYSYDYQTGQYYQNHFQWQQDYNKIRAEEISPDTTTRPGSSNSSNNSSSAFSPNIQQQTQSLFDSGNGLTNIKDEFGKAHQHQQHQQQHQQQQQQYHQLETAFVKPKAPEYSPHGYGNYPPHQPVPQHPSNYQLYSPYPYDPYGYNSYNNYPSNYPAYNMNYSQSPVPHSNWGLYQNSPMPPSATPVIPPHYPPTLPQHTSLGPPMNQAINNPPSKINEVLGEVTETNDNVECFQDKQMGGVAVALPHGSVVIECAKLEMHSTTALKKPNRLNPNRISLIFYQHRNLNRPKHGTLEWAEKMRLKKLGITTIENDPDLKELLEDDDIKHELLDEEEEIPIPKPAKKSRSRKDKQHTNEDKSVSSTFSPKSKSESKAKSNQQSKTTTAAANGNWTTLFQPCVGSGAYSDNIPQQTMPISSESQHDGLHPATDPLAISCPPDRLH